MRQCDFYKGGVFLLAKDDTNRRVFMTKLDEAIEVVDVHLHLAKVLMGQLADFQVNKDIGLLEDVLRSGDILSVVGKIMDRLFVSAKRESLVEAGVKLAFEVTQGPALLGGLDLIKSTLFIP
jgi:hypothetical protein